MGLDTVELIMEVEEAFDIKIPDEDAEKLRTIGDLHHYIANKLQLVSGPCLSSAAFAGSAAP
jgi:hypothetical protein